MHQPDYSNVCSPKSEWESIYGNVHEEITTNAPPSLSKPVTTTHYVGANLLCDVLTGRSVTVCLHFVNGTTIDWYSKKMVTVETSTYGAEFVTAKIFVELIVGLLNTLYYLEIPVNEKSYMF